MRGGPVRQLAVTKEVSCCCKACRPCLSICPSACLVLQVGRIVRIGLVCRIGLSGRTCGRARGGKTRTGCPVVFQDRKFVCASGEATGAMFGLPPGGRAGSGQRPDRRRAPRRRATVSCIQSAPLVSLALAQAFGHAMGTITQKPCPPGLRHARSLAWPGQLVPGVAAQCAPAIRPLSSHAALWFRSRLAPCRWSYRPQSSRR